MVFSIVGGTRVLTPFEIVSGLKLQDNDIRIVNLSTPGLTLRQYMNIINLM